MEKIEIGEAGKNTAIVLGVMFILGVLSQCGGVAYGQASDPIRSETWTIECITDDGEKYVDTTFVGRVRMRGGGIEWQVARAAITGFERDAGYRPGFGRRNIVTGNCVAMASEAESDLEMDYNRPRSRRQEMRKDMMKREEEMMEEKFEDPRKHIPQEVLPDSLYRKSGDRVEIDSIIDSLRRSRK
jgi:hypothetical protein